MKAVRDFRQATARPTAEEVFKRATKLAPNRKSGKERHSLYAQFDDDEDDVSGYRVRKESALDYYDDEE